VASVAAHETLIVDISYAGALKRFQCSCALVTASQASLTQNDQDSRSSTSDFRPIMPAKILLMVLIEVGAPD